MDEQYEETRWKVKITAWQSFSNWSSSQLKNNNQNTFNQVLTWNMSPFTAGGASSKASNYKIERKVSVCDTGQGRHKPD